MAYRPHTVSLFSTGVLATAFVLTLAVGASEAAVVSGTGEGEFSNLSTQFGFEQINNTPANGPNTQLIWGEFGGFFNPDPDRSTLTAVDTPFSVNVPPNQTSVKVGELSWFNASSSAFSTPDQLSVDYDFTVTFTSPDNQSDTANFTLQITNTNNPLGDQTAGLNIAPLTGLSFSLPNISVSNVAFNLMPAGGATFNAATGDWFNPEQNTSSLHVVADFTSTVPVPATLVLLVSGLIGLGIAARQPRRALCSGFRLRNS